MKISLGLPVSVVLSLMLASFSFAADLPVERTRPKTVEPQHLICYQDSDCVLAKLNCCGGQAVNKQFQKSYEVAFDSKICKVQSCTEPKVICVEQKCQAMRVRGGK